MKVKIRSLFLILCLSFLVNCSSENPAPAPKETKSELESKTTFNFLLVQGYLSFMAEDYQRASQLFTAIEALTDIDAYDGYSIGIAQEQGDFDTSICYENF
jgi:hypothetical protein